MRESRLCFLGFFFHEQRCYEEFEICISQASKQQTSTLNARQGACHPLADLIIVESFGHLLSNCRWDQKLLGRVSKGVEGDHCWRGCQHPFLQLTQE